MFWFGDGLNSEGPEGGNLVPILVGLKVFRRDGYTPPLVYYTIEIMDPKKWAFLWESFAGRRKRIGAWY